MSFKSQTFTTSTTWTCPAGVRHVWVRGIGGGGGGGPGASSTLGTGHIACAGAGGGGAIESEILISVVPGTVYNMTIGLGGAGGTADPPSGYGDNGGDSRMTVQGSGIEVARFVGAGGGQGRTGSNVNTYGGYAIVLGGDGLHQGEHQVSVGRGGYGGINGSPARDGASCPNALAPGGAGGANGSISGSYYGGGGGGGGGSGVGGGGAGGNGGAAGTGGGGDNGVGVAGGAGVYPGGGGGGGGGAGGSAGAFKGGGNGGAGANGRIVLTWVE